MPYAAPLSSTAVEPSVPAEIANASTDRKLSENSAEKLHKFRNWLVRFDTLRKTTKDALDISQMVRRLLYILSPEGDLEVLFDQAKVRDHFIEPSRTGENGLKLLKPSTINNYILSLDKFVMYLMAEGGEVQMDTLQRMRVQCSLWSTSLAPDIKKQKFATLAEIKGKDFFILLCILLHIVTNNDTQYNKLQHRHSVSLCSLVLYLSLIMTLFIFCTWFHSDPPVSLKLCTLVSLLCFSIIFINLY